MYNYYIMGILVASLIICIALYAFICINERYRKKKRINNKAKNKNENINNDHIAESTRDVEHAKKYVCENCGTKVEESDAICPTCGYYFEDEENKEEIEKEKRYTCDSCGAYVSEDDICCPNCGTYFLKEKVENNSQQQSSNNSSNYKNSAINNTPNLVSTSVLEEYVKVRFDNYPKIYTYLAPTNRILRTGERIRIRTSKGEIKYVTVVEGNHKCPRKNDMNYKIINII